MCLWSKNSKTSLRWNAGVDMSSMARGDMINITPDFEVTKISGAAIGYIGGDQIITEGCGILGIQFYLEYICAENSSFIIPEGQRATVIYASIKPPYPFIMVTLSAGTYSATNSFFGGDPHQGYNKLCYILRLKIGPTASNIGV